VRIEVIALMLCCVFGLAVHCSLQLGDGDMSPKPDPFTYVPCSESPLSDAAIARRALERLRNSSFVAIRALTCDVHEGMLTIRGRLPNFYTKQVALSLLADVEGVEEIADRVQVA
jgi:hypothetical protein